jgi:hypothetical protein
VPKQGDHQARSCRRATHAADLEAHPHTPDGAAQTSLRQHMRDGGGSVDIHNTFGTEQNQP